jgi:hypothetical protein
MRTRVASCLRSPATWILAALAVLRLLGIAWGLPASDGWDNDGVAPRDFLPGLVDSFTPGHFYTYPPLHLALLAVVTAPITLVAAWRAPSLTPAALVHHFIQVPYMTSFAVVARLVTVAMSLGMTAALARIAEVCWGRRAGWLALVACGLCVPLTYYAHTTCLDVPYLFWASLALLALARAVASGEPRRLRRALLFAALAVATKDQAYALFLVTLPVVVGAWLLAERRRSGPGAALLREAAIACALGLAALAIADGAVVNPSGFRARLAFLLGSASQDFVQYTGDGGGRARAVWDVVASYGGAYPWAAAALVVLGLGVHLRTTRGAVRLAGLVPLLAAASFTLAFNVAARRVEDRFTMPQAILFSLYAAAGADWLLSRAEAARARFRGAPRLAAAGLGAISAFAAYRCFEADAALLFDPRYDAEAWMAQHIGAGETIETYGLNVYLPRFPPWARVVRVGPEPPARRSPLPDVVEVEDAYGRAGDRGSRWIVISRGWVWRYLRAGETSPGGGRIIPPTQEEAMRDADPTAFFQALFRGELGFRLVHESDWASRVLRRVDINASLGCPVYVFERAP